MDSARRLWVSKDPQPLLVFCKLLAISSQQRYTNAGASRPMPEGGMHYTVELISKVL